MSPVERLSAALADCYRIERELAQGGMSTGVPADEDVSPLFQSGRVRAGR